MNNPIAFVFVGLPASGKSTTIKNIVEVLPDCFIYSTDSYIEEIAKQNSSTYNATFDSEIKHATAHMDTMLNAAIAKKSNIIWDQTNMSDKKRRKIIHKLKKIYTIVCICIMPPQNKIEETELLKRLASREGKTIPVYIINNMLASFVIPSEEEGFAYVKYLDMYGNNINTDKQTTWKSEISKISGYSRIGSNNI